MVLALSYVCGLDIVFNNIALITNFLPSPFQPTTTKQQKNNSSSRHIAHENHVKKQPLSWCVELNSTTAYEASSHTHAEDKIEQIFRKLSY